MTAERILSVLGSIAPGVLQGLCRVHNGMIRRCYDQKHRSYPYYGGRSISVCDEWQTNRFVFYAWAVENGWKRGLQIDRIDNDGNYEPSNCHWATATENVANRREQGTCGVASRRQHKASRFVGVTKAGKKWTARLGKGGRIRLGVFETEEEAAQAREQKMSDIRAAS